MASKNVVRQLGGVRSGQRYDAVETVVMFVPDIHREEGDPRKCVNMAVQWSAIAEWRGLLRL